MGREDTRKTILEAAADLVHRQGFNHTGLKEILDASGVPKGSFYFFFKSKEEFGLALVDYYAEKMAVVARSCFEDTSASPIARLRSFFHRVHSQFEADGCEKGCPIGNLCQEMSDLSPVFRQKLASILERMATGMAELLRQAQEIGEVPANLDPEDTARFITSSWEGAILTMKVVKTVEPLDRFERFIFGEILSGSRPDGSS